MFTPNLICERGHLSYAPEPDAFITAVGTLRFCHRPPCAGNIVRVRAIDGDYQYVSPLVIVPPEGIEEEAWH